MKKTVITHPTELNSLTVFRMFRKRGLGDIELSPTFDHPDKRAFEDNLNRAYYACGCTGGAKGLIVFLILGLAYSIISYTTNVMELKQAIFWTVGSAIGGAIIGKFFGLISAERSLRKTVHTIQAYWKPKDKKVENIILCG